MATSATNPSLSREAYRVVRQRILEGNLQLGQVISRRKLASELGMSFLPVSEALLRLEVEGLLESKPRAGTRVRIPSPEDLDGHYVVREALETQAARLFAERATVEEKAQILELAMRVDAASVIDPAVAREGTSPDAAESAANYAPNRAHYLNLHETLHRQIAEFARSKSLSSAIEQSHALASTWMCVGRGSLYPTHRHRDLAEALARSSPMAAAEAMREHVRGSQRNALERLQPYFELRSTTYSRGAKVLSNLSV